MATRPRTLLFAVALGFSAALVSVSAAGAISSQDPTVGFGGAQATTTTLLGGATTAVDGSTTAVPTTEGNQSLVEAEEAADQPLFTESRKVAAVIGGLVLVALALLLMTVRYIRVTKPQPLPVGDPDDVAPVPEPVIDPFDAPLFVDAPDPEPATEAPTVAPAAEANATAPGTDHDAADDDWQPKTGEHERVEIPSGTTLVRPGLAGRRKALGLTDDS